MMYKVYYREYIYAGGTMSKYFSAPGNALVRWDGNKWEGFGNMEEFSVIHFLFTHNNELYVMGMFDSIGGKPIRHFAKWDGAAWTDMGWKIPGSLRCGIFYKGELYVGGAAFPDKNSPDIPAICARLKGNTWEQVGDGIMKGWVLLRFA